MAQCLGHTRDDRPPRPPCWSATPAKRAAIYEEIQREHQKVSPFVIFAQEIEVIASRSNVKGMIWGPSFDDNKYWQGHKE